MDGVHRMGTSPIPTIFRAYYVPMLSLARHSVARHQIADRITYPLHQPIIPRIKPLHIPKSPVPGRRQALSVIFQHQTRHALEVSLVTCDQREIVNERGRCDQEIKVRNELSLAAQINA